MLTKVVGLLAFLMPTQSFACAVMTGMELSDVFLADAVIVGQVVDYEIVDVGRQGPLPNYARFKVRIEKVLTGDVSQNLNVDNTLTFTWDNSTFGEPEEFQRRVSFLFALRNPTSPLPPLRSGSGVILPTLETDSFTVLQAPCAGAFIFDNYSPQSQILQQVLETKRDPNLELEILEEFVFERDAFGSMRREIFMLEHELRRYRSTDNKGQ